MLDKFADRLLQPVNTSVISILGMFNTLLGIWLLLPFDSIAGQFSSPYMPEWLLGVVVLVIGIAILYSSIAGKAKLLSFAALLGFSFWIAVTGVGLSFDWRSPGWIFGLMIAMYCGFCSVNIRINSNLLNKKR